MLISASSEFVALCREQVALLAQSLGASLSIVYLTQELVEPSTNGAKLVPVVVYPETTVGRQVANTLVLPNFNQKLLTAGEEFSHPSLQAETTGKTCPHSQEDSLLSGDQIVLPLIHEDVMMGLLVAGREDRAWNKKERGEVERIAQTLSLACILDQRQAWLRHQLHQQQVFQEKQQDLLDNLLHQFRNPLTALRTFGKLLLKRLRTGDANREVANSIVRESDRLEELLQRFSEVIDLTVEDLRPMALPQNEVFVSSGVPQESKAVLLLPGTEAQEANCLITEVLEPLLISAQAIAQEKNLEITTIIPSNLPLVRANAKALREVLSNIIDNALKYTPSGGKILIQAGQQKDHLQGIAISDTGPGIPPQDLEHLGERHYRGVQAQTGIPGTGLGLAIAKQLIEQMQGEIQIFSPARNSTITLPEIQGTTVIVWLPQVNSSKNLTGSVETKHFLPE